MSERLQQYTLTFRVPDRRTGRDIATRLKSRAAEMGGFVAMEFSPPLLGEDVAPDVETRSVARADGEDEAEFNARKAAAEAAMAQKRKAETPVVDSALSKFGRVFGD